jgi:hypothetical protein
MRPTSAFALAPLLAVLLAACPAPLNAVQRGQQTAQEFNQDTRFGRTSLAMDRVAKEARDDFAQHHRSWGTDIRIADVELSGMKSHGERDLDVMVRVGWYRQTEQDLRVTTLKQNWRDKDGWELVAEERLDGDVGLLGEPVVFVAPPEGRAPAQFPTIRLRGAD